MVIVAQILLSVLALTANTFTVQAEAAVNESSAVQAEAPAISSEYREGLASLDGARSGSSDKSFSVRTAEKLANAAKAQSEDLTVATPQRRDTIRVHYRWSNAEIDPLYKDNGAAIIAIDDLLGNPSLSVDTLYIYSSSSSEGGSALNTRLSQKRGEAMRDQLVQLRDGRKFAGVNIMPLGANYPEFLERLKADRNIPYYAETVAEYETAVQVYGNDAAFKRLMKFRGGVPYAYIKQQILPEMRYADLVLVSHIMYEETLVEDEIEIVSEKIEVTDSLPTVAPYVWPKPKASQDSVRLHWYPAVKTNLLYDLVTAVNVEVEFPIGERFSVAVEDDFPWWNWGPNGKKYCFQVWNIGIEPRWWFARSDSRDWLTGHFVGLYGMSGKYDLQWDQKFCWQGEYWSAGFTYGYALPICRWANMEFSVSAGFLRSAYRHYQPDDGYDHLFRDYYNAGRVSWFGPTKAKISLVIPLGRDSHVQKKK